MLFIQPEKNFAKQNEPGWFLVATKRKRRSDFAYRCFRQLGCVIPNFFTL